MAMRGRTRTILSLLEKASATTTSCWSIPVRFFIDDVERAAERLPALERAHAIWFEEPFAASALDSYGALAERSAASSWK